MHQRIIYFILKQCYMFRLKFSHLQALTTFPLQDALPILGSHSVCSCGMHLSYNFLKKKVFISFIKCVIYRLCLKIKIFLKKFFLNGALTLTGYPTASSVVVLWQILGGTSSFSCLIRIVVFINRHRSLDRCTVLWRKVFLQILFL